MHDENHLVKAGAYSVDGNDMAFFIFAVDADQSSHEQLPPVKAFILPRGHYGSDYSSENHSLRCVIMTRDPSRITSHESLLISHETQR